MPIDPLLSPGLEAYLRGEHGAAAERWTEAAALAVDGEDEGTCRALAALARAVGAARRGDPKAAANLVRESLRVLDDLPAARLGVDLARLRHTLAEAGPTLPSAPEIPLAPRIPPRAYLRFALLLALLAGGVLLLHALRTRGYFAPEWLTAALAALRERWWTPLALVALYLILCPLGLPATPLILAGGAVFGAGWGWIYNFAGTFLGAAVSFALARLLGRDFVVHLAGERLVKVERLLERHGFWALVRVRFVPVPFPVVNFGAALAGVSAASFLASTALGLAPAVAIYTYFSSALVGVAAEARQGVLRELLAALTLLLALTFLPSLWRAGRRRRRYRALLARRRQRRRGG